MKPEHYQLYLKARYAYYWHTSARDAWRQIKHKLRTSVHRRLSPTYAMVEAVVNVNAEKADYTINGILFSLIIDEHLNEYAFGWMGEIASGRDYPNYKHGHDRNDAYWVLDYNYRDPILLIPEYTWAMRYRDMKAKWGKAYAARYATEGRNSDIQWAIDTQQNGEYERRVKIAFREGEDDTEEEWFSPDDLSSIYDWVASKIDSEIAQRQRQAA